MVKSMTGFGRGSYAEENFSVSIEIKTVNHRFGEISIRLPRFLNAVEDRIRKTISEKLKRGRIDVFINCDYTGEDGMQVKVDRPLVQALHKALHEIGDEIGVSGDFVGHSELFYLARSQNVIKVEEGRLDEELYWPKLKLALDEAVSGVENMRILEGENMEKDFLFRLDNIEKTVEAIEKRSPEAVDEYQAKLLERLKKALQECNVTAEPQRVLTEVALFADKTAVAEETVRLRSHCRQFREILQKGGSVGRKLDFLVQEFNREANTIGSKANDMELAGMVVDLKAEIEKLREQIQNVE